VCADDRAADRGPQVLPEVPRWAGGRSARRRDLGLRRGLLARRTVVDRDTCRSPRAFSLAPAARRLSGPGGDPPQDGRQDPTLLVVADVDRAIEAGDRLEAPLLATVRGVRRRDDGDPLLRGEAVG